MAYVLIFLAPLGSSGITRAAQRAQRVMHPWIAVADAVIGNYRGMLVRHPRTQALALLTAYGSIQTVPVRIVRAKLAELSA